MGNEHAQRPGKSPAPRDIDAANHYGVNAIQPTENIARDAKEPVPATASKSVDAETPTEQNLRHSYVDQHKESIKLGFDALDDAIDAVREIITIPEAVERSQWIALIEVAKDVALVATASGVGAWAALSIATKIGAAVASNAVKESVKVATKAAVMGALEGARGGAATGATAKLHFVSGLRSNLLLARAGFVKEWPKVSNHLYQLPSNELEHASAANVDTAKQLTPLATRAMLIEWANFVARAVHGTMKWNSWEQHGSRGAVPLENAAVAPTSGNKDPAASNIDPGRFHWGVDRDSPRNEGEYHGVLQVHVWDDGTLLEMDTYGMRLDYVGPQVRAQLRALGGLLRNCPLNKVVKVYSRHPDNRAFPKPMSAFLITADNHIRLNWTNLGRSIDVAEAVQQMSLARMEG